MAAVLPYSSTNSQPRDVDPWEDTSRTDVLPVPSPIAVTRETAATGLDEANARSLREAAIRLYLVDAFSATTPESLNDGEISATAEAVVHSISTHGIYAVNALFRLHFVHAVRPSSFGEALKWLGLVEDDDTWTRRIALLVTALRDKEPYIRAGAVSGLEAMDWEDAPRYLRAAAAAEPLPLLRRRMERVVEGLAIGPPARAS